MKIFDVSVPISSRLPTWPGDPKVSLERVSSIARGDAANVSRLDAGVHTGTHVDAPVHFVDGGDQDVRRRRQILERAPDRQLRTPAIIDLLQDHQEVVIAVRTRVAPCPRAEQDDPQRIHGADDPPDDRRQQGIDRHPW